MPSSRLLTPAAVVMLLVVIAAVDRGVTAGDTSIGSPLSATGSPSTSLATGASGGSGASAGTGSTTPNAVTEPSPDPTDPTDPTDGATASSPTSPAAPSETPDANLLAGIEVIPQTPGSTLTTLPIHTHAAPPAYLVGLPLPAGSSAAGRLTGGYPRRVLPPLPGSRVLTSSVSPSTSVLQVTLAGRSRFPVQAQLRFYRKKLARLGFRERPVGAVAGATASAFERGGDSVVVTVTGSADTNAAATTTYDVFAVLQAGNG